jgi:predicted RNase H-like HicB family nuclease
VQVEHTDEGYAVWCSGLPGCCSQGETEEEALENLKDAIETYVYTMGGIIQDARMNVQEFKKLL